jgi:hypothetical protein
MTIPIPKGTNVEAMAVVEDFVYLNCSKNPSIIQVTWISLFFYTATLAVLNNERHNLVQYPIGDL